MSDPDYAKAEAFYRYVSLCRLAHWNRITKGREHFVPLNERAARRLVERYPDLPEAFVEHHPDKAEMVIEAA